MPIYEKKGHSSMDRKETGNMKKEKWILVEAFLLFILLIFLIYIWWGDFILG